MEIIRPKIPPNPQKKYRHTQARKGLVRYELQIPREAKAHFEALVKAAADEYSEPFSERQRKAKARIQIFQEITQGITHEFFTLKEQIEALKAQVAALSPSFFKNKVADKTPLPDAIQALPDAPHTLKSLLATLYKENQQLKQEANEYQRQAQQFEKLYNATSAYNDELQAQKQK